MKRIISNVILVICMIVFGFCVFKLYGYYHEYNIAKDEYKEVEEKVVKKSKELRIDFDKLKKKNPDVIGWIYAKGTGISYPIVKGDDNEYYLHHTIGGTRNSSGTIFLDYRDQKNFTSEHTIVYGHHMKNGTMFAKLLNYRDSSFIKKHDVIKIYTPKKVLKLRVVSAYAKKANQKIPITFGDDYTIQQYKKDILARSDIKTRVDETTIKDAKRIYTFVTCSYEGKDHRTFVHCVKVN